MRILRKKQTSTPASNRHRQQRNQLHTVGATLLLAIQLLAGAACDSATNPSLEDERLQLLMLQTSLRPSSFASCQSAQTVAFGCADAVSARSTYISTIASAFGVTIASPQSETEVCTALAESSTLASFSEGMLHCYYNCTETYWSEGQNNGQCTASNYSTYFTNATNSINTCVTNCAQTGTVFFY